MHKELLRQAEPLWREQPRQMYPGMAVSFRLWVACGAGTLSDDGLPTTRGNGPQARSRCRSPYEGARQQPSRDTYPRGGGEQHWLRAERFEVRRAAAAPYPLDTMCLSSQPRGWPSNGECSGRESNPGQTHGSDVFCNSTTGGRGQARTQSGSRARNRRQLSTAGGRPPCTAVDCLQPRSPAALREVASFTEVSQASLSSSG